MMPYNELKKFFAGIADGDVNLLEAWEWICAEDRVNALRALISCGHVIKTNLKDGSATLSTPKQAHPAADIFLDGQGPDSWPCCRPAAA
jgi:hypothetical protein